MTKPQVSSEQPRVLRVWPGVAIVVVQWFLWSILPRVAPGAGLVSALGAMGGTVLLAVWWLFFSRAAWFDRFALIVLSVLGMAAAKPLLHESVARGNMGFQFFLHGVPVLGLAWVLWAVATRKAADPTRRWAMVAAIVVACGGWALVRSAGVTGDGMAEFSWRWSKTAEERLLESGEDTLAAGARGADSAGVRWPGLRGAARDGVVYGVEVGTDWAALPPTELWRRAVGPGVSSFAVRGDQAYTQEQRGEEEVTFCYDLETGEPVWRYADEGRFWDAHVGAGPRATPAVVGDLVLTLGATGRLNALDARDGALVWSRDAAVDAGARQPGWGHVSSPLVVGDTVVVALSGELLAYELEGGELRWAAAAHGGSYSSPQLVTLEGVPQILLLGHEAIASVAPADGTLLWQHAWPGIGIMQPAITADGDVLVSMVNDGAMPIGTRRISPTRTGESWTVEELWTTNRLKPSFNDVVVHEGHAYGFDGHILASIALEDGSRSWKGGRYGEGQVLLLPDQDLLLVLTEMGDLALVKARPEGFVELGRMPAIEGKSWNRPALVGDIVLVRNSQEMAAFRLPAG